MCRFDERIVAHWFQALGLSHLVTGDKAKELGWWSTESHLPWLCIDTLTLARQYKAAANLENVKLQTLIPHFGVTVEGPAHR